MTEIDCEFSISFPTLYPSSIARIYELVVRQEPKQARMCGVGGKGIHTRSFQFFWLANFSLQLTVDLLILHPSFNFASSTQFPNSRDHHLLHLAADGTALVLLLLVLPLLLPLHPPVNTQMIPSTLQAMHSLSFRTLTISCLQVSQDQMMMLNSIGSR